MPEVVDPQIAEVRRFPNASPYVMNTAHGSTMDTTGNDVNGIRTGCS